MAKNPLGALKRLVAHEQDTVDSFDDTLVLDDLSYRERLQKIEKFSRRVFMHGQGDEREINTWGNFAYSLPLPLNLVFQSNPIVDVPHAGEDVLISRFGVTATQLRKLAQRNLVQLNLIGDSQIGKDDCGYNQEYHVDLLDFEETGIRINGYRRRRLFECLGYSEDRQKDFIREYAPLLEKKLSKYSLNEINAASLSAPADSIYASAQQLANNLMYLEFFGTNTDRAFNKDILSGNREVPVLETISHVRGRKAYLCTPITASFGGTTNYSYVEYLRAMKHSEPDISQCFGTLGGTEGAFADYTLALSEYSRNRKRVRTRSMEFPIRDESAFDSYVDFLTENRLVLDRASRVLAEFRNLRGSEHARISLREFVDLQRDLIHDASRLDFPELPRVLGAAIGGGVGGVVGSELDTAIKRHVEASFGSEELDEHGRGRRMTLILLSGAVASATGYIAGDLLERQLSVQAPADDVFSRTVIDEYVRDIVYR